MAVAFCLVENQLGQVLLVQRGYGKEKYKWSLPGGHVDGKEGYQKAAARETREETGLRVEIVSTIMVGQTRHIQTLYGVIRGGLLRAKRPECLDAAFFDYHNLPELAFEADLRAIDLWLEMKDRHHELATKEPPAQCSYCNSTNLRLRKYPHRNPYRCESCKRTFSHSSPLKQSSPPKAIKRPIGSVSNVTGWEKIGERHDWDSQNSDMTQVPEWVMKALPSLDLHHAPGSYVYELVGRNYRYIVAASGHGATSIQVFRKPKQMKTA